MTLFSRCNLLFEHIGYGLEWFYHSHHLWVFNFGDPFINFQESFLKSVPLNGCLGDSVKCLTLDFGSVHNLGVVRSSPASGSVLGVGPALDSLSHPS